MIHITRLNGTVIYINAEMVKTVEPTPDAVITLTNGDKFVAKETAEVVVERIIAYQRIIHCDPNFEKVGE